MAGLLFAVAVTALVVKILFMKLQPHFVLMGGALILMAGSLGLQAMGLIPAVSILPNGVKSTGFWGFDLVTAMTMILESTLIRYGILIMAAAAYARYMTIIGANAKMADFFARHLVRFQAPYLILAAAFFVGAALDIFIPTAAGLAMILMVTMYPILVALGVSRVSAAALIVSVSCLDLGPASAAARYAAFLADVSIDAYFVDYQLPVAIVIALSVAIAHYFTQSHYDREEGPAAFEAGYPIVRHLSEEAIAKLPVYYGLLPFLPLVFLIVFSPYVVESVTIDTTSVMFLSMMIAMAIELARKNMRIVLREAFEFFHSMGRQFAVIITLLAAAQAFSQGIAATGAIETITAYFETLSLPPLWILLAMVTVITMVTLVTGSANGPFFAFAHLVPQFAHDYGVSCMYFILPVQLATGMARSLSPVSAVMIAVAGCSGISPFTLAKRTLCPMLIGLTVTVVMSVICSIPSITAIH